MLTYIKGRGMSWVIKMGMEQLQKREVEPLNCQKKKKKTVEG